MTAGSPEQLNHRDLRLLRASLGLVWICTGMLVLHPGYREIGVGYLSPLGLPPLVMWLTCLAEVALGLWLLLRPAGTLLSLAQAGAVVSFTIILAVLEPMLLVHPLGMLSKNLPFVLVVLIVWLVERDGWSERAVTLLALSMAVVWVTEGLLPKILFQQPWELQLAVRMHLPGDPSTLILLLGIAQVLSAIAALLLKPRWRRWVLGLQFVALLALPAMVAILEPRFLVHPFGPLIKNAPLWAGHFILLRRLVSGDPNRAVV